MTSFLLGAAVGAGIALLLAPGSGEETRHQLGEAARRFRENAGHKLDGAKHTLREGAKDVGAAISAGREAYRRTSHEGPVNREAV